jgi:hypothetical protein
MRVIVNNNLETTTDTGTGQLQLMGAVAGYRALNFGNNTSISYCIYLSDTEYEDGMGYIEYASPYNILHRQLVIKSSNSNDFVNFSAGTKYIYPSLFIDLPDAVPTSELVWGAIGGTLSSQTDLQSALNAKQDTLVSGTNIKTINTNSILGSGDLTISASAAWGGITGTLSSQTDLQSALDNKLDLSGSNANQDIDIGAYMFNAKSLHVKGTAGNGHLGLKHQSANITASASESSLGANSSGNPVWKNASNAIQSIMLENTAITGATKTKITYDSKGLVTSGSDATTADITDSTNKRYVTDAQLVVIGNTSGTNTGDETNATIKTKLGAATTSVDGYITAADFTTFNNKQAALVSGTNIKSINNTTLLGSGDMRVGSTIAGYVSITQNASTTLYYVMNIILSGVAAASRIGRSIPFQAGTFKNFYFRTNTQQPASGSQVVTLWADSSATSISVTIAANSAAGNFSDTTNTATITSGQYMCYEVINNATAAGAAIQGISIGFYASN